MIMIAGIPIVKYGFKVLCLNQYIPRRHPGPPPSSAKEKSVASGILHLALCERFLSIKNAKSPPTFTSNKYIRIILITGFTYLLTSAIFIARTFVERPKRLMKPDASWWSYKSPVVNEAMLALYNE